MGELLSRLSSKSSLLSCDSTPAAILSYSSLLLLKVIRMGVGELFAACLLLLDVADCCLDDWERTIASNNSDPDGPSCRLVSLGLLFILG